MTTPRGETDVIDIKTSRIEWGTPGSTTIVGFDAALLPWAEADSSYNAIATSNEPSRDGRVGTLSRVFTNFGQGDSNRQAGIWGRHDIGYFGRDSSRFYYNEGLITLPAGILCMPPALTTQTAPGSNTIDASGFNAGNRRAHTIMYNNRFVAFIKAQMFHDTSTSNPAITVPSTADNISDDVLATWIGRVNSVDNCLIIATDDQTDDAKYATAIASTMSWTSLITYANANDRIWWGGWFSEIGNGWHICQGKQNDVPGIYAFRGSDSVPLTISTLAPVVFDQDKDVLGNVAVRNTGTVSPAAGWAIAGSGDTSNLSTLDRSVYEDPSSYYVNVPESRWTVWASAGNITASDNSDASCTYTHSYDEETAPVPDLKVIGGIAVLTDVLVASGHDFSAIPDSAHIIGIVAETEVAESNASDNITWWRAQMVLNGSLTGENRADGTEPGTTDAYKSFGGTTDRWGLPTSLRGKDINRGQLGFGVQFVSAYDTNTAGKTGTITVDHNRLTVYYQVPGTLMAPLQGGFSIGPIPNEPTTMPVIEPVTDDETGITVRRTYREYSFAYDAEGDRPVGKVETPPINLNYCGLMAHFQGGVAIAGGADESTWNEIRWRRSDKQVLNLRFPKFHGPSGWTIVHMRGNGEFLWVWTAKTDNSDAQLWLYHDGDWTCQGVIQSKSNTIAARPIYWAESAHGAYQEIEYNFFPISTSSLAVAYQRVAKNPLVDPHLDMAGVTKHNGPLSLTTPELAWVPPELNTALMTVQLQNRRVDDNTSYGSVKIEVDTGGDLTVTTPEVNETFDAAAEIFTPRNLFTGTGTTNPGVAVPTGILKVTLDNENDSAETPQGLPIVFEMVTAWDGLRTFTFRMIPAAGMRPINIMQTVADLETLKRTKPVQRLWCDLTTFRETGGVPAEYKGHSVAFKTTDKARQTVDNIAYVDVRFQETVGGLS